MIYHNWMSFISDEAPVNKIAIPGAHNAGSKGMMRMACCQNGTVWQQYLYGCRHFCIRLDTKRNGEIVICHGLSRGVTFENVLAQFRRMLDATDSEIFIFDIREYYDQNFGPITKHYKADVEQVNALMKLYIDPEKYAFTDFENIGDVTMGDIRGSGKRYILINEGRRYAYSADCECILPWEKSVFGMKAEDFADGTLRVFDENETDGLYWFQTQQTPNVGTDVGITFPRKLDESLRPYFGYIINSIASDPERLKKVNIVAGDFMTKDYMKTRKILELNLFKGFVKPELEEAYRKGLYE